MKAIITLFSRMTLGILFAAVAVADEGVVGDTRSITEAECAKLQSGVATDGVLTREEKIAQRERALWLLVLGSGGRHDPCSGLSGGSTTLGGVGAAESGVAKSDSSSAQGASGTIQGDESGTGDESEGRENEEPESVAVGAIQGEQTEQEVADAEIIASNTNTTPRTAAERRTAALENGDVPKDIPRGNDDDVIAKQFRDAAIAETDPEVKARLWNEYRRYKGIDIKESPDA